MSHCQQGIVTHTGSRIALPVPSPGIVDSPELLLLLLTGGFDLQQQQTSDNDLLLLLLLLGDDAGQDLLLMVLLSGLGSTSGSARSRFNPAVTSAIAYDGAATCALGEYYDFGAAACKSCPTGTFNTFPMSSMCFPCPTGSTNGLFGQSSCTCTSDDASVVTTQTFCTCNTGYIGNASSGSKDACKPCRHGTFGARQSGQPVCTNCVIGMYQDANGQLDCKTCTSGTGTSTYREGADKIGDCLCVPDSFGTAHSTSDFEVQQGCAVCVQGEYQDEPGRSYCEPCPSLAFDTGAGPIFTATTTASTGSDSEGSCLCPAGFAGPQTNSAQAQSCSPCAPGYYSDSLGALECPVCARGTYSKAYAATGCTACNDGTTTAGDGATACSTCDIDFYGFLCDAVACVCHSCSADLNECTCADPNAAWTGTECACNAGFYAASSGTCTKCPEAPSCRHDHDCSWSDRVLHLRCRVLWALL
ncbi:hypothetical protein FOA52_004231 [Chlamydomonas sp. UWO 241]|nr:hypothetical protein FOA52_004231 [Chlamydomonas sp. UWO 241]